LACTATGAAVVSGGGHVLPVAVAGVDGAVDGARADRRWLGLVPASTTAGGATALAVVGGVVAAAAAGHASALSVGGAGRHGECRAAQAKLVLGRRLFHRAHAGVLRPVAVAGLGVAAAA